MITVIGSGFAGSVVARVLAERGYAVHVVEARDHIGGNAADEHTVYGLVHRYGPHLFHANADRIVDILSRFTAWRPYEHYVGSRIGSQVVPFPITLPTLRALYDQPFTEATAAAWLRDQAEPRDRIDTAEDAVVSKVGRDLFERFFAGYTEKMWGMPASQLSAQVTARVPARLSDDTRYFTDRFQAVPRDGYTALFTRMLDHARITVSISTNGLAYRDARPLVWTGPLDALFDYSLGSLPYRSLRFEQIPYIDDESWPYATINEPSRDIPYTRTTIMRRITGDPDLDTVLVREYPQADGDPYYPIPNSANEARAAAYRARAESLPDIWLLGRLGTYRYYNMDQVIAQALTGAATIHETLGARTRFAGVAI
jgi:UDP-galactopyranose mutase